MHEEPEGVSFIERVDRIGRPVSVLTVRKKKVRGWIYAESFLGLQVSLDEEASNIQLLPEPEIERFTIQPRERARFAQRLGIPSRGEMEGMAQRLVNNEHFYLLMHLLDRPRQPFGFLHDREDLAYDLAYGIARVLKRLIETDERALGIMDGMLVTPVMSILGAPIELSSILENARESTSVSIRNALDAGRVPGYLLQSSFFWMFGPGARSAGRSMESIALGAYVSCLAALYFAEVSAKIPEEPLQRSMHASVQRTALASVLESVGPGIFKRLNDLVRTRSAAILTRPGSKIQSIAVGRKSRQALDEMVDDWCVIARVGETRGDHLDDERRGEVSSLLQRELSVGADDVVVLPSGGRILAQTNLTQSQIEALAMPEHKARRVSYNPLRVGISVVNPLGYPGVVDAGTLGFFVRDTQHHIYLVSNSHVLAMASNANEGDPVLHPGTLDLTQQQYASYPNVSTLAESNLCIANLSHRVTLEDGESYDADVALARLRFPPGNPRDLARLLGAGVIAGVSRIVTDDGEPVSSARVYKVGRSSTFTAGHVQEIGSPLVSVAGGGSYVLNFQLAITPEWGDSFCERGDSGSPILNEEHHLVGMLCAEDQDQGWATPIHQVLRVLEFELGLGPLTVITG